MNRNKWLALGLGLGIAAIGAFVLKKAGLLDFKGREYDFEKNPEDGFDIGAACVTGAAPAGEPAPVAEEDQAGVSEQSDVEAATEETAEEEKEPE